MKKKPEGIEGNRERDSVKEREREIVRERKRERENKTQIENERDGEDHFSQYVHSDDWSVFNNYSFRR